jgi:hypothetical protein
MRKGGLALMADSDNNPGILSRCPSCRGIQRWRRKECQRCKVPVEIYKTKPNKTNASLEATIAELRAKVLRHEGELSHRQNKIRDGANEIGRLNAMVRRGTIEGRSEKDRLNDIIRRRTNEWRHEKDQRKKAEARGPADPTNMTFMGTPIADAAEAMLVAEELCRQISAYKAPNKVTEIAKRFLQLRGLLPVPKKVIRLNNLVKVEKLVCPECTELANVTSQGTYFCTMPSCGWEGQE